MSKRNINSLIEDDKYETREKFIRERFKYVFGKYPDLINPKSYNEKIQWLKLNWYNPLANKCADKLAVREYISEKAGAQFLNKIYGVWSCPYEINFLELPNKFVLKSTHASGQVIICKDKYKIDWEATCKTMEEWLELDYYSITGEWVYKNIPRRIICEYLIETNDGLPPKDYKVMCFDGEPKLLFVVSERNGHNLKLDFYDCNWCLLPFSRAYPRSNKIISRPQKLDEMLRISRVLSKPFPHLRVDFYIENDIVLIGELTFFPGGGLEKFSPKKYDVIIGSYLNLPSEKRYVL